MMNLKGRLICMLFVLFGISAAKGDSSDTKKSADSSGIFEIGRVIVKGNKASTDKLTHVVTRKDMDKYSIKDVPHAIDLLPGVAVTSSGGRAETGVLIRGFDLRQVPLYIDGIPTYVPYDGYVDLGRFTTSGISEIRVDKGYSSILYGPNALGGAINLISSKPVHQLELKGKFGVKGDWNATSDTTWLPVTKGSLFDVSIGSKLNKTLYMTAGASGLNARDYRLSKDYTATKYQPEGDRQKSYHNDRKIEAKLGYTPVDGSEYVLSYSNQHGDKGVPVYAGTRSSSSRYWIWPYWDRQSVYLNTKTIVGSNWYFKLPVYFDQFKNSIYSYDSSDYKTMKKGYAFKSYYNDNTVGSSLEGGTTIIPYNDIQVAAHYKRDYHTEYNSNDTSKSVNKSVFVDETKRKFIDNTFDIGLEDGSKLISDKLSIGAGASFCYRGSEQADNYFKYHVDKKTKKMVPDSIAPFDESRASAWNAQGKIAYLLTSNHTVSFSIARKTRFPTIKDRYSYKLGSAIPNPDLKAENAIHYDAGYNGNFEFRHTSLGYQLNLFYVHLYDAIQSVDSVVKKDPSDNLPRAQMQNVGEATISGASTDIGKLPAIEMALDYTILKDIVMAKSLVASANYTYAQKKNKTNSSIKFTDIPTQKAMFSLLYSPVSPISLLGSFEWNSERYENSQGTITVPGYHIVNLKSSADLSKNFTLELGVNNVFDKNYYLQEGYPEEGRNYYANLSVNFNVN